MAAKKKRARRQARPKAGLTTTATVASLRRRRVDWNPREMPPEEMSRLRASLREHGFLDPVVANLETGHLLGGHQRLEAAHEEGLREAPVYWVRIPEDREKAANVALNSIRGRWRHDLLVDVLSEVQEVSPEAFADLGFDALLQEAGAFDDVDPLEETPSATSERGEHRTVRVILSEAQRALFDRATAAAADLPQGEAPESANEVSNRLCRILQRFVDGR